MSEHVIYEFSIIIALGVGGQWLAWRLSLPPIFVWFLSGLYFGPYLGWIHPEKSLGDLFHPFVEFASAIILFEGGLTLKYREFEREGKVIRRLVSVGLVTHLILLTVGVHYILGWNWEMSALLASILIVTGPTVISPMIRQVALKKRPATFLKWEGIINDPIGALLAVLAFGFIEFSGIEQGPNAIWSLVRGVVVSFGVAFGLAHLLKAAFTRSLSPHYLKVPIVFGTVLIAFSVAKYLQDGAGLLAATIMGLVLGNQNLPIVDDIKKFKESFSTFLIAILFVSLASTLELSYFSKFNINLVLFLVGVLFVFRLLALWISTVKSGMSWKERLVICWFAPRGIVAASVAGVLGYRLGEMGVPEGAQLVPVVFTVIFATVVVHGFSLRWVAYWLDQVQDQSEGVIVVTDNLWGLELAKTLKKAKVRTIVFSQSKPVAKEAKKKKVKLISHDILEIVAEDKVDLSPFNQLLAATENDSYNALVCQTFAEELGANQVFQFSYQEDGESEPSHLPESRRGRIVASDSLRYSTFEEKYEQGFVFNMISKKAVEELADKGDKEEQPGYYVLGGIDEKGVFHFLKQDTASELMSAYKRYLVFSKPTRRT